MGSVDRSHDEFVTDPELPPRPLGPDSVAWRVSGDRLAILVGGAALLLQVAHPVVGAGVKEHSNFRADPWKRLDDTLQSLFSLIFAGDRALDEAARLRELHKTIKGVDQHGERYHALNPEAYWWVHATLFETTLGYKDLLGERITVPDQERMYAEWRQLGRILGLRNHHMPDTLAGFHDYFADVVETRLEDNDSVRDVLDSVQLRGVPKPPVWFVPGFAWNLAKPVNRELLRLTTVGLLPPRMRELAGLNWTAGDEKRLRRIGKTIAMVGKRTPARLRLYKIAYEAKRTAGLL
ncbi:oxygenase MpaB family protein [Actinokineospora sp.]|uniref:oxygenase MpaB family protein n=1 Tax=Actinokineospora sp. TaxID=1872133 RepID=UPI003D6A5DA9